MADTVPAMLEPGEFVIRKDAAKVIGPGLLHMLNNADNFMTSGKLGENLPKDDNIIYINHADRVGFNGGGKQDGGYINEYEGGGYADRADSYSLLDLTMPMLNNRLGGDSARGYQTGGFATSPESIFEEQGFVFDEDYAAGIQAYDPLREQNLRTSMMGKMKSPYEPTGGFAGSGFGVDTASRDKTMRDYLGQVAGMRSDYRSGVESQMAQDIASGTFEFREVDVTKEDFFAKFQGTYGFMPNWEQMAELAWQQRNQDARAYEGE